MNHATAYWLHLPSSRVDDYLSMWRAKECRELEGTANHGGHHDVEVVKKTILQHHSRNVTLGQGCFTGRKLTSSAMVLSSSKNVSNLMLARA